MIMENESIIETMKKSKKVQVTQNNRKVTR